MTAVDFPLLNNTNSPIQRDYHTLFIKYRYLDVYLQYLASTCSAHHNNLTTVIYYDICTIAIKRYITDKVIQYKFPIDLANIIVNDLYANFDPETFDVILHKSLHHVIQNTFYIQPRNKRSNKYQDIHELTDPNVIYSNMFNLFSTVPVDFDTEDIDEYINDSTLTTITDYITDYIVLAKRMQIQNYRMIDMIQHTFHRIRQYIREYYSIIYKCSYVNYRVVLTNERLTVEYRPNTQRIQFVEKKISSGVFKPTPECLGLGIASVHVGLNANSSNSSDIEHYLRRYKSNGKVNIKPLQTVKGRTLRLRQLYITNECPPNHTTHHLSELITKFSNAFPNPEINAAKYVTRMNYGLNYRLDPYTNMRQIVHRLLKLRSLIYLNLHVSVDIDVSAQNYIRYVEPVAKLVKFRFPDIICLRSDDDYKLLDTMLASRNILNHLQTFITKAKLNIDNYADIAHDILVVDAMLMTKPMAKFIHDHIWHESYRLHSIDMRPEYQAFIDNDAGRLSATITNLQFELLSDVLAIYNLDINVEYVREKVRELMTVYNTSSRPIRDPECSHLVYIRIDPSKMGGRIGHHTDDDPDYVPEEDDVYSWDDEFDAGYEGMP